MGLFSSNNAYKNKNIQTLQVANSSNIPYEEHENNNNYFTNANKDKVNINSNKFSLQGLSGQMEYNSNYSSKNALNYGNPSGNNFSKNNNNNNTTSYFVTNNFNFNNTQINNYGIIQIKADDASEKFTLPKVFSENEIRKQSNKNLVLINDSSAAANPFGNNNTNTNNTDKPGFIQGKNDAKEKNSTSNIYNYNNNSNSKRQPQSERKATYSLASRFANRVNYIFMYLNFFISFSLI